MTSGSWSGVGEVGDFRQLEWSWQLQAVGVELATSGSWSGVGDFRQLGVELATSGVELTISGSWSGVGEFRQLEWSRQLQAVGL